MNNFVIKVCCSEWENASRDKRELAVCQELGARVQVLAKLRSDGKTDEEVEGFPVHRITTKPISKRFFKHLNRFVSLFKWAKWLKRQQPAIISGHDLEGMLIAYLSTLFIKRSKKPLLIYDSHEFELGRERNLKKPIKRVLVKTIENFLIKKSSGFIVVSNSIAEKTKEIYRMSYMPLVVRSTPAYWELDVQKIESRRKSILLSFNNKSVKYFVMYHGALYPHRGIENMLRAVSELCEVGCFILGNGSPDYLMALKDRCNELSITDRVLFENAVSMTVLPEYVASADIGFATMEPVTQSYYYSLPNKLFENIQAKTPLIVSNFPELSKVIKDFGIGIAVDPMCVEEIKQAITTILFNSEKRNAIINSLAIAKEELCWEKEKKKLINLYTELFAKINI